jgi:hypothetical protein
VNETSKKAREICSLIKERKETEYAGDNSREKTSIHCLEQKKQSGGARCRRAAANQGKKIVKTADTYACTDAGLNL